MSDTRSDVVTTTTVYCTVAVLYSRNKPSGWASFVHQIPAICIRLWVNRGSAFPTVTPLPPLLKSSRVFAWKTHLFETPSMTCHGTNSQKLVSMMACGVFMEMEIYQTNPKKVLDLRT